MHVDEFTKQEGREALAKELTKEGMFELQKKTIRGNEYNVFVNVPQNLYEYFQFALILTLTPCLLEYYILSLM